MDGDLRNIIDEISPSLSLSFYAFLAAAHSPLSLPLPTIRTRSPFLCSARQSSLPILVRECHCENTGTLVLMLIDWAER